MSEVAWAAGFFDGEGSSGSYLIKSRSGVGGHFYPRVTVEQNERELLDRFCAAVGTGKVLGPYINKTSFSLKPKWHYHAYGIKKTQLVRDLLWPFLGSAKRAQFDRTLEKAGVNATY